MVLTVKKGMPKKELNEALRKIKRTKKLDAKRHLGKVKWGEDALEYQKRLRICSQITYPFLLVLLPANCVKNIHRSDAMLAIFAWLTNKNNFL